jgi:hypothetical protein
VSAYIYIEGGSKGADSKYQKLRCQEAFHKLLDAMGFKGRKPRLVACGGRQAVYDRFVIEHSSRAASYVAMWIDSEEPMSNIELTWTHLENVSTVPKWRAPCGAADDQILFMTTCMESWIVADRDALREHFGNELQESALPANLDLENRARHEVQDKLYHATRNCSNPFRKGERSFEIFGLLSPTTLKQHLPSFVRVARVLNARL